jgi:hypothetical protein
VTLVPPCPLSSYSHPIVTRVPVRSEFGPCVQWSVAGLWGTHNPCTLVRFGKWSVDEWSVAGFLCLLHYNRFNDLSRISVSQCRIVEITRLQLPFISTIIHCLTFIPYLNHCCDVIFCYCLNNILPIGR